MNALKSSKMSSVDPFVVVVGFHLPRGVYRSCGPLGSPHVEKCLTYIQSSSYATFAVHISRPSRLCTLCPLIA